MIVFPVKFFIFIYAQNNDCWYMLEPPRQFHCILLQVFDGIMDRRNMTFADCSWNDETRAFTSTSNAMFVLFVAEKPVEIKAFRIHYIINDGNETVLKKKIIK